jgi:hypothetical protein
MISENHLKKLTENNNKYPMRPLHDQVLHLDYPLTVPDEDAVPNF